VSVINYVTADAPTCHFQLHFALLALDSQVTELLGRSRLIDQMLRAGVEVAIPMRDRGVDLIAYVDKEASNTPFVSVPIQMKVATKECFSLDRKYEVFPGLLIVYVWHISKEPDLQKTYALTYAQAHVVAGEMGWLETPTWKAKGSYANTQPGAKLKSLLEPYAMSSANWKGCIASLLPAD